MDSAIGFLTQGTDLNIWTFLGLCSVSFIGSFLTASLGLGGGVLSLAAMAAVLPPTILIPVHGIMQLGSNAFRALLLFRHLMLYLLPAFLVGTLIGTIVGANTVIVLPGWALQAVLGLFILYATWVPGFRASKPGPKKFFGVGIVGGFVTMFVGGTGPLLAPFVNAASDSRQQFVGTHACLMSFQHLIKVTAFGAIGFSFGAYLPLLAGLLIFGFAGTYIGKQLLNRLPEKIFRSGLKVILTLLGLKLLYSAVQGGLS